MSGTPKRIEQEPLYPCCCCYDECCYPAEELRWFNDELWCSSCYSGYLHEAEVPDFRDLEPFVPKCDRELAEAQAEIERKDKLIEQMREQIIAAIKEAGRHFAVGDTVEILHAALSAAERGGK